MKTRKITRLAALLDSLERIRARLYAMPIGEAYKRLQAIDRMRSAVLHEIRCAA